MGKLRLPHPSVAMLLPLLGLLLLPTDIVISQKPIYMMLVPSLLHTGIPEKGCLLLSHLNETVSVSAFMESVQGNQSLFTDLVVNRDLFQCVSFTVLPALFNEVMFLTVQVKGPTHEFKKKSTVMIKNKESLIFVQTDKSIYKPGQTVKFRVVSLDENFHPLNELISLLYIKDPKGNHIAQWSSFKLESGLRQLSFPLSSEPPHGSYKVVIRTETGRIIEHSFFVEEFVLPKFEVKVAVPETITIMEEEMSVSVCGVYTYGKPVPGHVAVRICRNYSHPSDCFGDESLAFCENFSEQVLLVDGKGTPLPSEMVFIEANEANHHSNATTDKNGLAWFSINTDDILGTSLSIRAKYKDSLMCYGSRWLAGEHVEAWHMANAVFSPTKSFVHLGSVPGKLSCEQTLKVQARYTLNGEGVQELKELVFCYLIMAKGGIARSGTHTLPTDQGDKKGHFSILIPVESDLAPIARLLLYIILPGGEVVADTVKYEIGNCLVNKVDLSFSPNDGLPASRTLLKVKASPQSLCALRAVDQSVLLVKPEAELSASSIYDLLPVKDLTGYPEGANLEEKDSKDCIKHSNVYVNGILYSPVLNTNEEDMYGFLKDMGLKVFTNSDIRKPKVCGWSGNSRGGPVAYQLSSQSPKEDFLKASESPKEIIRKYFPETWIWDLVVLDSTGRTEKELTAPDTITEWKAGALCLSNDTGLGLSPVVSFQAFQPFFVELTMPYSVVRGEAFTLKATVLNYLQKCIRVAVQLEASPDFLTAPMEKEQKSHCICLNERHTVSWVITPKSLGNVNFTVSAEALNSQEPCGNEVPVVPERGKKDTIIKSLLVEPEGLENEVAFNSLHCPTGAEVSEQITLKLPPDVVKDSARASVTVLGDILGSAMQNTQDLLRMPYGCGEQNMVLFAPNIYILDYLNETQQLTQKVKDKAIDYLNMGYQRQLNYKHQDGSYSTFGEKSGTNGASTWLTAFVLKSFVHARKYIFIHETYMVQALLWLSHQQKDNGCFRSSGSLFNNAIKGGVNDEVTLSAYITIALLEMSLPVTDTVVRNALFCLDTAWKSAKEGAHGSYVYAKALLAYAFALAGNQAMRTEILKSLSGESVKEDISIHWASPQKPMVPEGIRYQAQAPSAEVEMSAYVLLAYLTAQPAPTQEDLTAATLIVKWLAKQQNSHGGFSSTQDTVVALHALSKYGAATFTRAKKNAQVAISSSKLFSTKFQVNNDNQLLLQTVKLPTVPGDYTATVKGEGCVYLQTSLKYNVLPGEKKSPFALRVQTLPRTSDDCKVYTSFQIILNVSYTGSRSDSNMAIVDVKMVSGFVPLKPTAEMVESSVNVSRTEVSNNHVLIYLDKVSNQNINLSFTVQQDILIKDLKPAIVKVYDYYEKDEFAVAQYSAPCIKGNENA
ncbi:alpha-2-macroglobulin isoform X2 [Microtus ochrogaster]|uniref:Alpha-2-macroglobulin isoform X2 n=1 Tax=Microtus ochrogaster TaxID=79684 RepID=A0ABM1UPT9_MICOH|nr:alpha-2-macroglobulin isoform X2 [Microtus ochrogaster]